MEFILDNQLDNDSAFIADMTLCRLQLMNDEQYPWLILVPRRENIVEMYELSKSDQRQLWEEIALISQLMKKLFSPHKLNIGALGNIVRQLHIHVIARNTDDKAWPGPVWGAHPTLAYQQEHQQKTIDNIIQELKAQNLIA
ncbi:HIT domain-containing protein [Pleionea sp. CnH1-48]|uniref:HIT domain-containing protein n=1 Tax=Pleionea sp. CnH1-48 TaxID=2954494 RepID=UPI002097470E|nr:HIT family protein [Pleionea sp. CnH1-48]MCO7227344.1 HIT family protein [Pleionea sp. CnH1-48]